MLGTPTILMSLTVRTKMIRNVAYHLLQVGFLLGLFFNHENGGDMFLQTVGWLSTNYMALYH
jgi:hypothetical protein